VEESDSSGIGELLAALRAEADQRVAQLDAEARLKAEGVVDGARADAVRLAREPVDLQEPDLVADAARRLAAARLGAVGRVRQAREASFQDALGALSARLASLRDQPRYARIFAALLVEALGALPSGRRVLVDPRDEDLARRTARELGTDLVVEPVLTTWGGVVLDGGEGCVARNTLEERFANAEPALRLALARIAASAVERRGREAPRG
jgi:vacuolar-type H+-ATPase subunit E/Vma4